MPAVSFQFGLFPALGGIGVNLLWQERGEDVLMFLKLKLTLVSLLELVKSDLKGLTNSF